MVPVHDSKYYFPDGDTVILVENTLFKVRAATGRFQSKSDIIVSTDPPVSPDSRS